MEYLFFLFILFVFILFIGQFFRPTRRRSMSRRGFWNTGGIYHGQNSITPIEPPSADWIQDSPHQQSSHTDNIIFSDNTPSNYAADPPVAGVDNSMNTGSTGFDSSWDAGSSSGVSSSGGSDFGGFGGGGDFDGGGAGGDWSSGSN